MPDELIVSTLEDENDGDFSEGDLSLREAIALANEREGTDTISFQESLSGGNITLNDSLTRDFDINDSVSIVGLGQDNITLDGGFIFNIADNVDVSLDGLNFIGATIDNSGNLVFSESTISQTQIIASTSDNSAIISRGTIHIIDSAIVNNDGGQNVGILIESGTATIQGSTISDNNAPDVGLSGIIIRNGAIVDIINSTIAKNTSRSNAGITNSGTVDITNSTIVNNLGGMGVGGINNFGDGIATVTSSIVANNAGRQDAGDVSGGGQYTSGGNNLIGNADGEEGFVDGVNGDIVGNTDNPIDPELGELQNNGGITQTYSLLDGSPAIDAGSNPDNLATDQRGTGFDRTVGNGTDIGAFEVQTVSSLEEIIGTDNSDFLQGTAERDLILGLNGADLLDGLAGDDFLNGGEGNDLIRGGEGNDSLEGDGGNDLLTGGGGNDVYLYDLNPDGGFFDRDSILDFHQSEDIIAFRPFSSDLSAFDDFEDLDTNGSGVLDSGDERVQVFGTSTIIDFSDLFGRSLFNDTVTLSGVTDLDESNFLFNI